MIMSDTMQIRISEKDKQAAEKIFSSMGLSTSAAIKLFIRQTINMGMLPFTPIAKIPNATTISAMKRINDPKNIVRYDDSEAALKEWDNL